MQTVTDTGLAIRAIQSEIEKYFAARWSPRAMNGEPLSQDLLEKLMAAARWAPSAMNEQPWCFLYAHRGTPEWERFFELLADGNKRWVKKAAVMVLVLSRNTYRNSGKRNRTHSFDTGAAWMCLALAGAHQNLVVHGMAGFDYQKARTVLNIPSDYTVEAMVAIGYPGKNSELPQDLLQRERPSPRKDPTEFLFRGGFPDRPAENSDV